MWDLFHQHLSTADAVFDLDEKCTVTQDALRRACLLGPQELAWEHEEDKPKGKGKAAPPKNGEEKKAATLQKEESKSTTAHRWEGGGAGN